MKPEIEIIKTSSFSNVYKEEVNYTLGCNMNAIDSLSFSDLIEIRNTLTKFINSKKKSK